MPQRRSWKPPKQDHSVHVQQLFKEFITRNCGKPAASVAPNDTHTNFFQPEATAQQRKLPGIFDRAVYARFERDVNGTGFKRQESTAGFRTELMKWIDQQRHQRQQRTLLQKTTRLTDYLNLPDGFFSGVEQLQMPIHMADKTLDNMTTNFIPPATSTPFEQSTSFGVSGVLSDPDEFQPQQSSATDGNIQHEWESFLKNVDEYFSCIIQNNTTTALVDKQRKELKTLLIDSRKEVQKDVPTYMQPTFNPKKAPKEVPIPSGTQGILFDRPSWKDHSLISNQHFPDGLEYSISPSGPLHRQLPNITVLCFEELEQEKRINRPANVTFLMEPFSPTPCLMETPEADILLSASPPSPTLCSKPRGKLFGAHSFLVDQTRTDDTKKAMDALLEDLNFGNQYDGLNFNFNFSSQHDDAAMEITFTPGAQPANETRDESLAYGMDISNTTLFMSQELQKLF